VKDVHKLSTLRNDDAPSYSTRIQYLRLWLAHASRPSHQRQSRVSVTDALKATRIIRRVHILVLHFVPPSATEGYFFSVLYVDAQIGDYLEDDFSMSQKTSAFVTKCYISGMTTGKLFVHPWSIVWRLRLFEKMPQVIMTLCLSWLPIADNGYCPIYQVWGRRTSSTEEARFFIRSDFYQRRRVYDP